MDVDHYLKWLNNESVTTYSEQRHRTHTTETQREYITSFVGSDHFFWEIQRTGNPIGSITAYRDMSNRTANIGIMIGEYRLWGNGYAAEAWDAVGGYLFDNGTRKIEGGCMATNLAMVNLFKKLGYTHEATVPGHFLRHGHPEDLVCYGKTREAKVFSIAKKTEDETGSLRV